MSITKFLKGNDAFVVLPTGFGKTVCYSCIPTAFDIYHERAIEESSIIIVRSPLIKEQVNNLSKRGIATGYVDAESSKEDKIAVNKGH
jgi:superfamily II DNA helicase RecQ